MSLSNIKLLREKTNAPVMEIKKALGACSNDPEKAIQWLIANYRPKTKATAFGKLYTYTHQVRISVMLNILGGMYQN
jgi:translation elongation factor EF-Ts